MQIIGLNFSKHYEDEKEGDTHTKAWALPLIPWVLPLCCSCWVMNKIHSSICVCSFFWEKKGEYVSLYHFTDMYYYYYIS